MFEKIFEPITIGKLALKNRLVVSAMVTQYAHADGTIGEQFIAYHEAKAKGGWGLVITEDYIITPQAGGYKRLPGLYDDAQIASHRQLTQRVHAAGGKICAQIYHAGRETGAAITGVQPVAPSPIKDPTMPDTPHELTLAEIKELVEAFGDCARRVQAAGFDAVEIHGAHGYLINQFVSAYSNKRTDEYGGTLANRARFALEVVQNVRAKVGSDFPIFYRMSAVEGVPGGLSIEESKVVAMLLEEAGVDALHVSQGVYTTTQMILPPSVMPKACYIDNAAEIKKVVSIPVIGVGRINDPYVAEEVLRSGKADLVTMARASLADPQLPNKAQNGQCADIIRCIGCMQGCTGELGRDGSVRCMVNPLTGREGQYDLTPVSTKQQKKVLVIGGGVAGCEAAIAAAMKGHQVTLYEKTPKLGGQWALAAIPVGKSEFTSFLVWQRRQLEKLQVELHIGEEITAEQILERQVDAVILATGSQPMQIPLPGLQDANVCTAHDILAGRVSAGQNVAVIGGGLVGAETADHLAEHGSRVSILEMLATIVKDGEPVPTGYLLERLAKHQVQVYTSAKITRLTKEQVYFEQQGQEKVLDAIDQVVFAVGVKSHEPLSAVLVERGFKGQILKVGDALKVKNGYYAIQEGFEAGLSL